MFVGHYAASLALKKYDKRASLGVLLLVALWAYLRSSSALTSAGKYGMGIFVVFLILVNIPNVFGPLTSDSKVALAVTALAAYFVFAAIAHWLDKKRS